MFDRLYDWTVWPQEALGFRKRRRALLGHARGRVLEVGAGTGLNLPLYPLEVEVVALEPNPSMLKGARRRYHAARYPLALVMGDGQALPFADSSFDMALATLVFCTVPDPGAGLREVLRVLKPGGRMLLLEHVRLKNRVGAWLQHMATPLWKRVAGGCHLDRDTLATVGLSGFKVEAVHQRFTFPFREWILEVHAARPAI